MTSVLVTGGLGYIGSHLVPKLYSSGFKVTVIDNLQYLNPLFADIDTRMISERKETEYRFVEGDIRDADILKTAMHGQDYIIHLAAISGLPACAKYPVIAEQINILGVENLVKNIEKGQRVIFASSGSVYGLIDGICTEESKTNPVSLYAQTKLAGENILSSAQAVILRFATGFGYASNLRLELLVNKFVFDALKTGKIELYENNSRRTFIGVEDMADAFIFTMEHYEEMQGQSFNVGHESMNLMKKEIAQEIKEAVEGLKEKMVSITEIPGSDPDKRDYAVDYSKIRSVGQGFIPKRSLKDSVRELVQSIIV